MSNINKTMWINALKQIYIHIYVLVLTSPFFSGVIFLEYSVVLLCSAQQSDYHIHRHIIFQTLFHCRLLEDSEGFPGGPVSRESTCNAGDAGDTGSVPGPRRRPGWGQGSPLQYCSLENPMNRRAWRATVHGSQSRTRLTRLNTDAGMLLNTAPCVAGPLVDYLLYTQWRVSVSPKLLVHPPRPPPSSWQL